MHEIGIPEGKRSERIRTEKVFNDIMAKILSKTSEKYKLKSPRISTNSKKAKCKQNHN